MSLEQLGIYTSGAYRCEISGDAPEFKLVSQTANMTIAGISSYYHILYSTQYNELYFK